jgi:acid stress chaperone HdeB
MRWNVLFVSATLPVAASLPSAAQISIDMNKITCGRWLGYSPEERDFVRFWMSGYYNSAANSKILNYDRFQRNGKGRGLLQEPQVRNPADGDQEPWLVAVRDGLHPDKQSERACDIRPWARDNSVAFGAEACI